MYAIYKNLVVWGLFSFQFLKTISLLFFKLYTMFNFHPALLTKAKNFNQDFNQAATSGFQLITTHIILS